MVCRVFFYPYISGFGGIYGEKERVRKSRRRLVLVGVCEDKEVCPGEDKGVCPMTTEWLSGYKRRKQRPAGETLAGLFYILLH